MIILIFFFFFSSRRRHTRLQGDWSSDVCSSDLEDPTTWTRPWTVKQEFNLQDNKANRIYTEPRCHEGNFGMTALRSEEHTSELQSPCISYAVFCLKKKKHAPDASAVHKDPRDSR